jgi:hypothetical protein
VPMRPAMMLVTTTEVIVTVANPAMIILGRISCSMAATSSGVSPAPLAASCEDHRPREAEQAVSPMEIDIGML